MTYFRTGSMMSDLPENISRLGEMAYNLWFSWHPEAQELFRILDKQLWQEVNHNPVKLLLYLYPERLEKAAADPSYLARYHKVMESFDHYLNGNTWFKENAPQDSSFLVAYFSAELGIHESAPVYSGGLGVLAGDHCKSSSDLGLPLVGVGLLYKNGYFGQRITREGWQEAIYPLIDFREIPVTPCTRQDGSHLLVPVEVAERTVSVKVWQQEVGRTRLYLLDTDIPLNQDQDRRITSQLYGGDQSTRLSQEIILGIGGVRALRELGWSPTVWHINEGHAAFLILERIRELVLKGLTFFTAAEAVKANTVFTTHTPVPAGHDVFAQEMITRYLCHIRSDMKVDPDTFLSLGWDEQRHVYNMTKLALSNSSYTNAVSRLHARVSKELFSDLYPNIPGEEIPIHAVTNGVHLETWAAPEMTALFEEYLGSDWQSRLTDAHLWQKIHQIPDPVLWETHQKLKDQMIHFVRSNLYRRMKRNFEPVESLRESLNKLGPQVLTIGFARRFASYKRANLLLKDRERLAKLLNSPGRPVVMIFAGKAHPADHPGQQIIKQLCDLEKEEGFRGRVIFVENYDLHAARHLLHGVDLWLNTPRRPMEASGTSGQKAAVNGVLNCSILDGWWPEAYNGKNGFAIGSEQDFANDNIQDEENLHALFDILEQVIIPCYYQESAGIPSKWIRHMKESLGTIPRFFNTDRMVKEYYEDFYLPCSQRAKLFSDQNFQVAAETQTLKQLLRENWCSIDFQSVRVEQPPHLPAGPDLVVEADIHLGPIAPKDVVVEVYTKKAGETGLENVVLLPMSVTEDFGNGTYRFRRTIEMTPGAAKYALRVRPHCPYFAHTFELPLVKWTDIF
ncbi:alpha-glucan family phosphorylase [Candidatus Formimonas warabiya]|uniref:Alpha-glucan phosphorylase n=1 Tax=Formimonas warabiya TaxID=1761012 RepID=A0A3G1L0M6_FORW1|nr:alpha-glucan family phosphorylase [Candidatus Formimonas warabiya]ATW28217.1 alpha-glucan phosphorylase [Candidatus Formimonas warabiya]